MDQNEMQTDAETSACHSGKRAFSLHPKNATRIHRHNLAYCSFNCDAELPKEDYKRCFICQKDSDQRLIRCEQPDCTTLYHEACVNRTYLQDYYIYMFGPKQFKCFRHFCNGCFAAHQRTSAFNRTQNLSQCTLCLRSFHPECVPPGFGTEDIVCSLHYLVDTTGLLHMPGCFNCQKDIVPKERVDCDRCLRSFHTTCGQFMVDVKMGVGNRICTFCRYGFVTQESDFCHVLLNGQFRPGRVISNVGRRGMVPVRLFYDNSVKYFPHGLVVPFYPNDPFLRYYRKICLPEIHKYEALPKLLSTMCVESFPVATTLKHREIEVGYCNLNRFPYLKKNIVKSLFEPLVKEEYNTSVKCQCKPVKGIKCNNMHCPNRHEYMECSEDCGTECQNGPSARIPDLSKLEVFECPFRGMGLRAKRYIQKGEPIGEYRGHVLSKEQVHDEMTIFVDRRDAEAHLYFMQLGRTGLYVDSRRAGTITRYANHSCDPTVFVAAVTVRCPRPESVLQGVDNVVRQILYAKKDVPAGTEITFDYGMNWDEYNTICRCGSKHCSGYLNSKMKPRRIETAEEYRQRQVQPSKKKNLKEVSSIPPSPTEFPSNVLKAIVDNN